MVNRSAKNISLYALYVALAFIFSYLEALIPFSFGIPGVKLGLANLVIVYVLYISEKLSAVLIVTFLRVILVACTFGNLSIMMYSFGGAIVSALIMYILYRTNWFSVYGVSVAGGVSHNIGQMLVAGFIFKIEGLLYYMPFLLGAGVLAGFVIALIAKPCIGRLKGNSQMS